MEVVVMAQLSLLPAILIAFFVSFSTPAEAKDKESDRRTRSGKLIVEQDDDTILLGSSEANREDQKVYGVLSIGLNEGIGIGATAGYFLEPDFVIALSIEGSANFFFGSSSMQTLQFKKYFGNSFYGFAGPALRQTRYTNDFGDAFEGAIAQIGDNNVDSIDTNYHVNDMGIDVAIGNQWQWSHFTMGCDWVGWYEPLQTTSEGGHRTVHYKDGTSKSEDINIDDDYKKQGRLRLLNFYLGMSF